MYLGEESLFWRSLLEFCGFFAWFWVWLFLGGVVLFVLWWFWVGFLVGFCWSFWSYRMFWDCCFVRMLYLVFFRMFFFLCFFVLDVFFEFFGGFRFCWEFADFCCSFGLFLDVFGRVLCGVSGVL